MRENENSRLGRGLAASGKETMKPRSNSNTEVGKEARGKIMDLWRQLPSEEKEHILLEFLRDTDVGRRLADGGYRTYPSYMWDPDQKGRR